MAPQFQWYVSNPGRLDSGPDRGGQVPLIPYGQGSKDLATTDETFP
jgi:hypothetical protein